MCAGSRRDLAAAGFPERGTEACGNLWHPTCSSRPLWYPSSRCSVLGAQCWGLRAANTAALLAGSPHTSAPQEAGGGAVLLSTPFPGSKSKSLFLWSSGWRPAVRQPDGKARGLSSFLCLLAADVLSRSLGLPLELCQALGVHSAGWSSALPLGCSTRPMGVQPCPGSPTKPGSAAVLGAREDCRVPRACYARVPAPSASLACPLTWQAVGSWSCRRKPCVPRVVGDLVPPASCTCGVAGCSFQPEGGLVSSLPQRRWGAVSPYCRQRGGCSIHVHLLKGSGWVGGMCASCQPQMPAILQL